MTSVEGAHNIADVKYSMFPVVKTAVRSKDRRDSIGTALQLREQDGLRHCRQQAKVRRDFEQDEKHA